MMRSLYSGVSGLKNHQTRMDVIGNNIANVNTTGYKASRVVFQDIYSQTLKASAAPSDSIGGTNPTQIGLGVTLASIDVLHTSSATAITNNPTDLALEGDGYFVIKNTDGSYLYTRAGNFYLDNVGNLVTTNGQSVMGIMGSPIDPPLQEPILDANGDQVHEFVYEDTYSNATGAGNEVTYFSNMYFYYQSGVDGSGDPVYTAVPSANLTAGDTTYTVTKDVYIIDDTKIATPGSPTAAELADPDNYKLKETPADDAVTDCYVKDENGDFQSVTLANTTDTTYDDSVTLVIRDYTRVPQFKTISWAAPEDTDFTLGGVYGKIDPNAMDEINLKGFTGISIDQQGVIRGLDANGESQLIGIISIATFTNPSGLEKKGSSNYIVSANSGDPMFTVAKLNGAATINPGGLEMSNVDLSSEFTDMIITQRGFQANSRIITVSDSMLEELVNLKR